MKKEKVKNKKKRVNEGERAIKREKGRERKNSK